MRKTFLKLFIGFLTLTGLVAIFTVLGGDFGAFQIKVLSTTFTISAASICAMSCAAFIERRHRRMLGLAGIVLAGVAAFLVIVGVWFDVGAEAFWKTTGTFIVLAAAFAHAFLLVLPHLMPAHRWVQWAVLISIGLLALQILAAIWGEIESDWYYKFLTVVSIVVVLLTLVIPILMKMKNAPSTALISLTLTQGEDGTYTDENGTRYRVIKIPESPEEDVVS